MRPITVTVGPLTASSATNVRTASGVLAAGAVTLNGSLVSGGVATFDMPRRVLFTTTADETTKTVTLVGTNWSGNPIGEVVTLVNASTVAALLDYKTLSSVVSSAALTGNLSIGTNGVAGSAWVMFDSWASPAISLQVAVSGTVNYTVQQSLDDPNDPTNSVAAASMAWVNSADANVVGATATAQSNYAFVPRYARILLNSGSGTATATVIQSRECCSVSGLSLFGSGLSITEVEGPTYYLGTWNASTNTPTLASSTAPSGPGGSYYIVSVAGTTNLNGIADWTVGDWVIWSGSVWQKLEGGATAMSVGSTVIASGATTRVLYDNAGVLGEYTITGTGSVAMSASPTFTGHVSSNGSTNAGGFSVGADQASPIVWYWRAANTSAMLDVSSTSNTFSVMSDNNGVNDRRMDIRMGPTAADIFSNWNSGGIPFRFGAGTVQWNVATTGTITPITGTGAINPTTMAIGGATIGSDALAVTGTGTISGVFGVSNGAVGAPSIYPAVTATTGIWWRNAAAFNLSFSGTMRYEFGSAGDINVGGPGDVGIFMNGTNAQTANDTGVSRISAGVVGIGTGAAGSIAGALRAGTLALGGATIGSNALAVTGTVAISGAISIGNTVNVVSPTAPNRTVTMVIGGTTYYPRRQDDERLMRAMIPAYGHGPRIAACALCVVGLILTMLIARLAQLN